jgi:hypothetical protein
MTFSDEPKKEKAVNHARICLDLIVRAAVQIAIAAALAAMLGSAWASSLSRMVSP